MNTERQFPIPNLLQHPNIPKPLHGVSPRTVLGAEWWDIQRKEAYERYDYRCYSCGVEKRFASWHQWLEAHEAYNINYSAGTVELVEIVALCHACHNYVHSGRLWHLLETEQISYMKWRCIMAHGLGVLKRAKLEPWWGSLMFWYMGTNQAASEKEAIDRAIMKGRCQHDENKFAPWNQWRLIIDGDEYYSKFKSYEEWDNYYSGRL